MNLGGAIHLNKTGIGVLGCLILILLFYGFTNKNENSEKKVYVNLHSLLEVSIKAAENGGKEVVDVKDRIKINSKGLTKEGLDDSVTTADFLSHCSMIETIKHYFPTVKIVSEEAKFTCESGRTVDLLLDSLESLPSELVDLKDVTIWIDPLDATYEYAAKSEKLYHFVTTMVCVAVKDKPIIGVIHKPFSKEPEKETSWVWVGKGKSDDLSKMQVHAKNAEDKLKIIVSLSHRGQVEKILNENFPGQFELTIAAGAGYKALEVAYGNVNAYIHVTAIKKWDICAGNAVLNALGGKMTTKNNQNINYQDDVNVKNEDGLIASITNHATFLGKL